MRLAAIEKRAALRLAFAIALGAVAGLINGFLGAGAGVVLMYGATALNEKKDKNGARDNFATVVACVFVLSVVSAVIYSREGAIERGAIEGYATGGMIGGYIGAALTSRCEPKIMRIVFAALVIVGGINMLI